MISTAQISTGSYRHGMPVETYILLYMRKPAGFAARNAPLRGVIFGDRELRESHIFSGVLMKVN